MANYQVYAFCTNCNDIHYTGVDIELEDGPAQKQSVSDLFEGKELPSEVADLANNRFICPTTQEMRLQEDNDQVFVIPFE